MPDRIYIVTGASRGLGEAMAGQLLGSGITLLGISRHESAGLRSQAEGIGARLEQWTADLSRPIEVATRLQQWLTGFEGAAVSSATLINNAAMLTRIGPVDSCTDDELSASLRVGLEAPMLLTAAFLRATRDWPGQRRVLNISSGLGRHAMAGTAPYCAAKAGMDHYSRAVALDQAGQPNGARIVSLAPGVIDTDMQVALRAADPQGFPSRATFLGLKSGGQLASTADAASRVLAFLDRADFGSEAIADVRG